MPRLRLDKSFSTGERCPIARYFAKCESNAMTPSSTVYELLPETSGVAEPLYASATFDKAYGDAFFEGVQPGRLFVDDPVRPTSAMLARTYEYFLAGEPAPALRRFLIDAPAEPGVFQRFYGYVSHTESWRRTVLTDHGGSLEIIGRRSFRLESLPAEIQGWRNRVPAEFEIVPIGLANAEQVDREAHELIGLFWSGYERYARSGFGFCAMTGGQAVGACYAAAVSMSEANLSIAVEPDYRRLGLAFALAAACIEEGLARGGAVTWDCDLPNVASGNLAKKLGFIEGAPFEEHAFPGRATPAASGSWQALPVERGTIPWVPIIP
jgi:RimJ/RimL family protein N-acetyltransferase